MISKNKRAFFLKWPSSHSNHFTPLFLLHYQEDRRVKEVNLYVKLKKWVLPSILIKQYSQKFTRSTFVQIVVKTSHKIVSRHTNDHKVVWTRCQTHPVHLNIQNIFSADHRRIPVTWGRGGGGRGKCRTLGSFWTVSLIPDGNKIS